MRGKDIAAGVRGGWVFTLFSSIFTPAMLLNQKHPGSSRLFLNRIWGLSGPLENIRFKERWTIMHWEPSSFPATLFFPDKATQIKRGTSELDLPTLLPSDQINFPNLAFHTCEHKKWFPSREWNCPSGQHQPRAWNGAERSNTMKSSTSTIYKQCANNPLRASASSQAEVISHPPKKRLSWGLGWFNNKYRNKELVTFE